MTLCCDPAFVRAATALAALGIYLQIIEWIDIRPWNNITQGNGQEGLDVALAVAMAVLVVLLLRCRPWSAWLVSALLSVWAMLQISTWWIPYLAGASPAWERTYAKWFQDNLQVLPTSPGHLPPDASHLVLHALIVLALAMSLAAALAPTRKDSTQRDRASGKSRH